jgi:solute carrier family 25 (mitochondrial carnitine/acylcarnitine transporter), member 20/29
MNDIFVNSFIAGGAQTLIGHPFDTIKTYKQVNYNIKTSNIIKNIIGDKGLSYLYRGFLPPFIGGCIQNSILFSTENYFQNITNNNNYLSGFLAGSLTSLVVSPAELIKANMQINEKISINEIIKEKNLLRGLGLTMIRDSIGFSIYFGTFNYLQNKNNNPLINGGITGVLSWIYSYPVDVIKTKYQISNDSLNYIIKNNNMKMLISGMPIMLIRAFFVNAGIFYIYENLK